MRIFLFVVGGLVLLSSNVLLDGPGAGDVPVHGDRVWIALGLIVLGAVWNKLKPRNVSRRNRNKPVLSVKFRSN